MNAVKRFYHAEYGYYVPQDYDFTIRHLKSYSKDTFAPGLETSSMQFNWSPINVSRFCKDPAFSNCIALANEDGFISIHDGNFNADGVHKQIHGHNNVIFDLAWCPGALKLVTVSGDHTAILWDVGETVSPILKYKGHTRSVKTVSFKPEDQNIFATGSRDGKIMIWDSRLAQNSEVIEPDNSISCHFLGVSGTGLKISSRKMEQSKASLTGVIFQNEYALISCASADSSINVWDIRKCYSVYKRIPIPYQIMCLPENNSRKGFSNMVIDQVGVKLYANCMDDTIYCFNVGTYMKAPVAKYYGHTNRTFYIKSCLSDDDKYLISGSSDGKTSIWNVKKPGQPIAHLTGHQTEVSSVDCCRKNGMKLVTCSEDGLYRFWQLSPNTDKSFSEEKKSVHLQGWVEPVVINGVKRKVVHTTPQVCKRNGARIDITPDCNSDSDLHSNKRLKRDDQRTVLSPYSVNSLKSCENKGPRRLFDVDMTDNCNSEIEILSPTSNLPNYIIDGTSPHHRCIDRQKENKNWLAKLQQVTPPPNSPHVTPKRKSAQKTPKACGNLLKFFKLSVKQSPSEASESQKDILAEPIVPLPSTS